jgi:diguanylate cyclase (GGDEF)-like protein
VVHTTSTIGQGLAYCPSEGSNAMPNEGRSPGRSNRTDHERQPAVAPAPTPSDAEETQSYIRGAALRIQVAQETAGAGHDRQSAANRRDELARTRDEQAAERDREALAHDREVEALAAKRYGRSVRPSGLRNLLAAVRERAAADRERARLDREHAARDRELAALDRAHAERERRAAGTDELTGARRRGVGLEELEREIQRARRTGTSLVAVFVDVDNLKAVNDKRGHRAGDELLREVVGGVKRQLRPYDLVIRLGGDEFLCVLPGVSIEQARARFAELNAELEAGSVSVGFSELHDHETRPELIEHADRDLLTVRAARRRSA